MKSLTRNCFKNRRTADRMQMLGISMELARCLFLKFKFINSKLFFPNNHSWQSC